MILNWLIDYEYYNDIDDGDMIDGDIDDGGCDGGIGGGIEI